MKHYHREATAISQALAMWHAVVCTMLLDLHRILQGVGGGVTMNVPPMGKRG